jgi:hypothetical protein
MNWLLHSFCFTMQQTGPGAGLQAVSKVAGRQWVYVFAAADRAGRQAIAGQGISSRDWQLEIIL